MLSSARSSTTAIGRELRAARGEQVTALISGDEASGEHTMGGPGVKLAPILHPPQPGREIGLTRGERGPDLGRRARRRRLLGGPMIVTSRSIFWAGMLASSVGHRLSCRRDAWARPG